MATTIKNTRHPQPTTLQKMNKHFSDDNDELSPLLRQLRQQPDGFKAPEDYFTQFQQNLEAKLAAERSASETPLQVRSGGGLRRYRMLAAAAAVLLLLGAGWWAFRPQSNQTALAQAERPELTPEDLENYLLEHAHEFETEQLAAVMPTEALHYTSEPETEMPEPASPKTTKKKKSNQDLEVDELLKDLSDKELEELL